MIGACPREVVCHYRSSLVKIFSTRHTLLGTRKSGYEPSKHRVPLFGQNVGTYLKHHLLHALYVTPSTFIRPFENLESSRPNVDADC